MRATHPSAKSPATKSGLLAALRSALPTDGSGAPAMRPGRTTLLSLLAILAVLLLTAASASANSHAFETSFNGSDAPSGAFSTPAGVAVETSTGDIWVTDSGSGAIEKFTPFGAYVSGSALTLPGGSTPSYLAVDNSTGPSQGDLYVTDLSHNTIDKLDPASGELVSSFGTAGRLSIGEPQGVAVDSHGDLYVVSFKEDLIEKFNENGTPDPTTPKIGEGDHLFDRPIVFWERPTGDVAVNAAGDIYTAGMAGNPYEPTGGVFEFDSAGTCLNSCAPFEGGGPLHQQVADGVTVDPANEDVYATIDRGSEVAAYTSSGTRLDTFGAEQLTSKTNQGGGGSLAVSGHGIYVSNDFAQNVDVFSLDPKVLTGAPSETTTTTAKLSGRVNPEGEELKECRFEVGPEEGKYTEAVPCTESPAEIGSGSSPVEVHAQLSGLSAGATYHYRLSGSYDGVHFSHGSDLLFGPPGVSGPAATHVGAEAAILDAQINPFGLEATYHFEYTTEAQFKASGFSGAISVPATPAAIGSGIEPVAVHQPISSLQPETPYTYRLLAHNSSGSFESNPKTFTTPGLTKAQSCPNEQLRTENNSTELPECRAYEQVTPQDKNGFPLDLSHILGEGDRAWALSIGLDNGAAAPLTQAFQNFYQFARTPAGWETIPFANYPPQLTVAENGPNFFDAQGDSMLLLRPTTSSVFARDLYLHRVGGPFVAVGPLEPPSAVPPEEVHGKQEFTTDGSEQYFEASADLTHALFTLNSSLEDLPPGVTTRLWPGDQTYSANQNRPIHSLYEYAGTGNTEPMLVGITNEGPVAHIAESDLISQCGIDPGGEQEPGTGLEGEHHNAISADGSVVFFTAKAVTTNGCGAGAEAPPVNELFARIDNGEPGAHTVSISEPNALAPSTNDACTSTECKANTTEEANFRPANFEGASADGSKVFFTSTQQLTDNATQGSENLYLYDFSKPEGQRLSDLSAGDESGHGPAVQGVGAISEDGSHVYFVAHGVLAGSGENEYGERAATGKENLYLTDIATGRRTFIATLSEADSKQWNAIGVEPMGVTADGGFLVFTSHAHLTPDDTSAVQQVFRYDATTGALVRVSIGEGGFNEDGNASEGETGIDHGVGLASAVEEIASYDRRPALSEDGRVVFASSIALTPRAYDNEFLKEEGNPKYINNVYEYSNGHVYLISPPAGAGPPDVTGGSISPSGKDIFFESIDPITPTDTDTLADVYDARESGGFPVPVKPAACQGDTCQGNQSGAPSEPGPSTPGFHGPPNVEEKPCKKGTVKKHGRCVKPHKHKKSHKKHKRAGANRGGGK